MLAPERGSTQASISETRVPVMAHRTPVGWPNDGVWGQAWGQAPADVGSLSLGHPWWWGRWTTKHTKGHERRACGGYRSGEVCSPFAFGAIGHRRSRGWVHAEARRTQRRRMGGEAWERVASLSCVSCLSWFSRWWGRRPTKHTKGHERRACGGCIGAARFARRLFWGRLDIGVRGEGRRVFHGDQTLLLRFGLNPPKKFEASIAKLE